MSAALRERVDELEEENRQLRAALRGPVSIRYAGVHLTRRQMQIVDILLASAAPLSQAAIIDRIDISLAVQPKTVDVHICKLRKKLGALNPPVKIDTVWGVGFQMNGDAKRAMRDYGLPTPKGWET